MARRVYLHIGTMKSASTYLQQLLWDNAESLAEQGILYPLNDHYSAFRDLFGRLEETGERSGEWSNIRRMIRRHPGDVILSNELLAAASRAKVKRIVKAIPAEVHVVLMARDPGRVVPSHWQTTLRNGRTHTWAEFASAACRDDDGDVETEPTDDPHSRQDLTAWFWRHHDVPAILARWRGVVAPENLRLVTVPPSGSEPDLVARRFASVVGCEFAEPEEAAVGNPSMGAYSAEFLRRLNEHENDVDAWSRRYAFKVAISRALTAGAASEPRFGLSDDQLGWMTKRAQRMVEEIEQSGVSVVGDLDDLIPVRSSAVAYVDPSESSDTHLLEAASNGMLGMVGLLGEVRQARRGFLEEIRSLEEERVVATGQIARQQRRIERLEARVAARPSTPVPTTVGRLRSAARDGRLVAAVRRRLRR